MNGLRTRMITSSQVPFPIYHPFTRVSPLSKVVVFRTHLFPQEAPIVKHVNLKNLSNVSIFNLFMVVSMLNRILAIFLIIIFYVNRSALGTHFEKCRYSSVPKTIKYCFRTGKNNYYHRNVAKLTGDFEIVVVVQ